MRTAKLLLIVAELLTLVASVGCSHTTAGEPLVIPQSFVIPEEFQSSTKPGANDSPGKDAARVDVPANTPAAESRSVLLPNNADASQSSNTSGGSVLLRSSVIVRVKGGNQSCVGSGTVVNTDSKGSDILTCAHISDDVPNPTATIEIGGKSFPAKLDRLDRKRDLAVYHVVEKLPAVKVADRIPSDGSTVVSVGKGSAKTTRILTLDTYSKPEMFLCPVHEELGTSGGGLFFNGELIGVVHGHVESKAMSLYVGLDSITDFLTAPLPPQTLPNLPQSFVNAGPMRLEVSETFGASQFQQLECVTHSKPWCQPCHRMQRLNGSGNERLKITYTDDDVPGLSGYTIPITTFADGEGKQRYIEGVKTVDELTTIIEKNGGGQSQSYAATGSAGAIHGSSQIRSLLNSWRQYVGENVSVSATLDRTGAQSLPLLARGDWTWIALLGPSGHFQVESNGWKFPVNHAGFAYRVRGDDVTVDPDAMTLQGLLRQYPLNPKSQAVGAMPYGLFVIDDIITIGAFISAIHTIVDLLHPSVDLILPGQIAGSAVLKGDVLTVDFSQPVTIKAKWIFTFQLAVKRVVISESNIHVDFSGSGWITSRDFAVK